MIFMHSPTLAGVTNKVVDFSNLNNTGKIYLRVSRPAPASFPPRTSHKRCYVTITHVICSNNKYSPTYLYHTKGPHPKNNLRVNLCSLQIIRVSTQHTSDLGRIVRETIGTLYNRKSF